MLCAVNFIVMEFKEFDELVDKAEDIVKNQSAWRTKMHNLLSDVYKKGKRKGHKKAVEICKNALNGIENANSSNY